MSRAVVRTIPDREHVNDRPEPLARAIALFGCYRHHATVLHVSRAMHGRSRPKERYLYRDGSPSVKRARDRNVTGGQPRRAVRVLDQDTRKISASQLAEVLARV